MRRLMLPVLLLASLACNLLRPAGPGPTASLTSAPKPSATALPATAQPATALPATAPPTPTPPAAAYTGQFDCYGSEAGMGAYAGRLTLQPGGVAMFKDYDGQVSTGGWTYDTAAGLITFSGAIALASASYTPTGDTLVITLAPNPAIPHAEGGSLSCQRAQPGITGPP